MARPMRTVFNGVRNASTWLVAACVRALLWTVRYRVVAWDRAKSSAWNGDPVIYILWHNVMMLPLGHESRRRTVALISPGGDGTFAARIVSRFGVGAVRGSTSKQGATGVLSLLRERPADASVVLTPDGPRGPRYRVQPGVAFLASRTGLPVVPVGMAVTRAWHLRSWDRFRIPKPFARAEMVFGEPRRLAPDLDRDALDRETLALEGALHELSADAGRRAGVSWPD